MKNSASQLLNIVQEPVVVKGFVVRERGRQCLGHGGHGGRPTQEFVLFEEMVLRPS